MKKAPVLIALTILLALPLSGCGRRGQLGSPDTTAGAATGQASQEGRYSLGAQKAGEGAEDAPPVAPQRPFILDSIL